MDAEAIVNTKLGRALEESGFSLDIVSKRAVRPEARDQQGRFENPAQVERFCQFWARVVSPAELLQLVCKVVKAPPGVKPARVGLIAPKP